MRSSLPHCAHSVFIHRWKAKLNFLRKSVKENIIVIILYYNDISKVSEFWTWRRRFRNRPLIIKTRVIITWCCFCQSDLSTTQKNNSENFCKAIRNRYVKVSFSFYTCSKSPLFVSIYMHHSFILFNLI